MEVLSGLNLEEIQKITDELHASKFRARQIHNWIYLKSVNSIDDMTDLSVKFREELKKVAQDTDTKISTVDQFSLYSNSDQCNIFFHRFSPFVFIFVQDCK